MIFVLMVFVFYSCTTETVKINEHVTVEDVSYEMSGFLEENSRELVRNSVLEMTEMMKNIVSNHPQAYEELLFIFKSDFYYESYVGLFELLEPETAVIYQRINMDSRLKGSFKKAFEEELRKNYLEYPNLSVISLRKRNNFNSYRVASNLEDFDLTFYDEAAIAFYAPYIEDLNDNEFDLSDEPTLIPGVIDADSGLGYKKTNDNWEVKTVDDDYSESNFSIMIEPNNFQACGGPNEIQGASTSFASAISDSNNDLLQTYQPCLMTSTSGTSGAPTSGGSTVNIYNGNCDWLEPKTTNGYIRQVFIGHAKINNKKQYDKFISFTGNGGGSEIRIGMLDSRGQITIDSIGDISENQWDNIINVKFSRKDIRKGKKKWVGSLWHKNWQCSGDVHEALFGVYEEDNEGDIVFDDTITWQDDELFSVDATIDNKSKDQIIRKWKREKTEFFITNLLDQGGGFWEGKYSFSDRDWAIYDRGTNFSYTMPHRWVPVGNNINY